MFVARAPAIGRPAAQGDRSVISQEQEHFRHSGRSGADLEECR